MVPATNSHLAAPLRQSSSDLDINVELKKKEEAEAEVYL